MSVRASQNVATTMKPDQHILLCLLVVIQPISGGVIGEVVHALFQTFADTDHFVGGGGGRVHELNFADGDADHEVVYDFVEDFTDIRFVAMTVFAFEGDDGCGFDGFHTYSLVNICGEAEL